MENIMSYIACFNWFPAWLLGLLGLGLGWLLFRGKVQAGDLSIEGEGQLRADTDSMRARINDLEGRIGRRDVTISGLETKLTAAPVAAAAAVSASVDADGDDETYALEWRNRYLAARVKYLEGRISDAPKAKTVKKKVVKKKATPKKAVAKKTITKKAAPKKAAPKKAAPKKAAPKKAASIMGIGRSQEAVDAYWANARKYDKGVSRDRVYEIVKYCGIALNSRDASLVACSDEKELDRVVKGYCAKKLGMNEAQARKAVAKVCTRMKAERYKSRVTFYHLLGKGTATATKKAAPKKASAKKAAPAKKIAKLTDMDKYLANVRKYDPTASRKAVESIVKYCGISLKSRDASLVACSDEKELDRVVKNFCTKKLGMTKNQKETVAGVCTQMKPDRFKNRVTFYYLCAKSARKLAMFK